MGNKFSEEEKAEIDREKFMNNPRYIAWDEHGNLRYGLLHPIPREIQLRDILTLDYVDDEDNKEWCIMDSAWVAAWLAYTHGSADVAPSPGPCRNDRLLTYDYNEKKYKGRFGLYMAVKERPGDYRRVSMDVWNRFRELYPGSGPTIVMTFKTAEKADSGFYDTSSWKILDPPPPPEDSTTKKKKKKLFGSNKKNPRDHPDNEEKKTEVVAVVSSGAEEKKDAEDDTAPRRGSAISSLMTQTKTDTKIDYKTNNTMASSSGTTTSVDYSKVSTSDAVESRPSASAGQARRESFFENVYFKD